MNRLADTIRQHIHDAIGDGLRRGPINAASVINIGPHSHATTIWSDDEKTIVQRDGHTTIIRHDKPDPEPPTT